ncbi:uncharacterized protein LOC135154655 [Lytechinus pictus]|uniref:uncharacterized protein LOC135154655 n=1 Tax=Lytechinus pictus TaxID=7653 RepID=UPI0030BA1018
MNLLTDRYLNYRSFHHPSVLRFINKTLVKRAHEFSDQIYQRGELEHIKLVLKCNNYPSHMICTELPPSRNPHVAQPMARVVLSYLGSASHKIQRILREADIEFCNSSSNKLQSAFTTHKDKRNSKDLLRVYRIPCECGKVCIDQIFVRVDLSFQEHKAHGRRDERDKSAIIDHARTHDHRILWHQWTVREALEIGEHNTVPQDSGLQLSNISLTILDKEAN